jgi:glycosyltransferase involved in cell wall biosynthesis
MKICIDGFELAYLGGTGLWAYAHEFVENLFQMYPQPQYSLLSYGSQIWETGRKYGNVSCIDIKFNRMDNDYKMLEDYLSRGKINLYHSLNNGFAIPGRAVCKYVMTVQDMIPISNLDFSDTKYKKRFGDIFFRSLGMADRVIAVSGFIRDELMKYTNVDERKVTVIYPGTGCIFKVMDKDIAREYIRKRYNINDKYILFAGGIHVRKNMDMILGAFRAILQKKPDLKLIIAGKTDGKRNIYFNEIKDHAKKIGVFESTLFTGTVNYEDMPYLYNGAECFINPSSYEGFPISSIEAMACGIPSMCKNGEVFREVLGDGGIYFEDEKGMVDGILKLLRDEKYKKEITARGLEKSRKYRWDDSIKRTVKEYEALLYGKQEK